MIDWLDETCKSWGRCTRWIIAGTNSVGDPEGWPSADTIARAREGMLSLGGGPLRQNFPEVRLREALEVSRAMCDEPHMPINLTAVMWTQYVIQARPRHKLPALSRYLGERITVAEYYRLIDGCHFFLLARLTIPTKSSIPTGP